METFADYSLVMRRLISLLLLLVAQRVDGTSLGGNITVNTNLKMNGSPYIVSHDVIVDGNATLTIQPGVELQFQAGVAFQVKGSLQAKGRSDEKIVFRKIPSNKTVNVDDLNVTSPYNDGIRLRDGKNYRVGRLEIFLRGRWGTVCYDWFDIKDAQVACRQLGFLGANRYYIHGRGFGPIWLDDLGCQGTEKSLLECKHRGIGNDNCGHNDDIGVECHSLINLTTKVYWKGMEFTASSKPPALHYVEISDAYEAIKDNGFLPDLHHVTVKNSLYGVRSDNMSSPLIISDSLFTGNKLAGIEIKSRLFETKILNTIVENTTHGDGMSYAGIVPDSKDFCTTNTSDIASPITLQAVAESRTSVDCFKIIRTHPGRQLTVHYQSIMGETFELGFYDGDTENATILSNVNQWTGVNQAVTPVTSSGHAIYIRFRYSGWNGASVKFSIMDDSELSSFVISNCSFNDNRGKGMELKDITAKITISTTVVFLNKADGLSAERILGTMSTSDTHFINNSAHGFAILSSSLMSCNLHQVSTKGNSQNGLYFQRVALKSNVSDSIFDRNARHGFTLHNGAGAIEFRNMTAVSNMQSGVRFYDGKTSSKFFFSDMTSNGEDGCCMSNQGGAHHFFKCRAINNARHGISLFDVNHYYFSNPTRHQFIDFGLVDSIVKDNTQYGLKLGPECRYWSESAANVTITINNNQIYRNSKGGIFLAPDSCSWTSYARKPRKIEAAVRGNHFEENKVNAFYVYCTGFLGLEAVIDLNKFINNADNVITLLDDNNCGSNYKSNAVHFDIRRNNFTRNRAENILFIDYGLFPDTSSATIANNTFEDNEAAKRDLFSNLFHRTTSRAIIVLKEGNFTLRENVFENPNYDLQISTLRHDHRRVIDAKFNWWGTEQECEIADKIFDFRHRVQLSPVEFFPYLLSRNKSCAVGSNISRPSCFIRKTSIGGIVDRPLALRSVNSPYEVRDDLIILPNGSLVIPKNITLLFPPRSAMFVQGTLVVDGDDNERVKFKRQGYNRKFRLFGGSSSWEGRLEFWVNKTWMPVCLSYYRSFTVEATIVCQQLNLFFQRYYHGRPPTGQETTFVHNVVCDANVDADIMNCSADTRSYSHSCRGNIVYIYCLEEYWAGLHLAMSDHQSVLRHLDITDAGFAYRSDINIPGTALRIDLNHHNISNIFINNSAGMGVQVVHQSLLYNQSLMPNSIISNTQSYGIHSVSPSLILTNVNVTENNDNGFVYTSAWDQPNTFAINMASPDVSKIFHGCSRNITFLPANRVYHFMSDNSLQQACQRVMETEGGYKLVIQLYYVSHYYYYSHFMEIYDGVNMSAGSPWKMGSSTRTNRPVFKSTGPSVLFNFKKYAYGNFAVKFLVYTVEEGRQVEYNGGHISITRSKVSDNTRGGILITGSGLRSLSITDSEISHSREYGVKLQPTGISFVNVSSTNLENNKLGIVIDQMSSPEFTIENCAINGSSLQGIYIYSVSSGIIRILNSSVTFSGDGGLTIGGSYRTTVIVRGNRFSSNQCPDKAVINIRSDANDFVLRDNVFESNFGSCVLLEGTADYVPLTVTNNLFSENQCENRCVIEALRLDETARFANNTFWRNRAQSVVLMQMVHNIDSNLRRKELAFTNNTLSQNTPYSLKLFSGNTCKSRGESCAVVLSGIQYYKNTNFHLNKFNNSNFASELCVRVPAISQRDVVNVTHNWWGTAKGDGVRDRIWDFDDNYDFAIADDWPFLLQDDDPAFISLEKHDCKQRGDVLSGRLFESLTLRASQSSYSVISDFTVLENVTLSIEAGVTIRVSPGVSILVAGELQALGTLAKPIIFTVKEPVIDKCRGGTWGNVRFVSTKDVNATQKQSSLYHVEFSYCGDRHGNSVPAIEAEANVPELRFITVRNCTSGGLRIHAPGSDVKVQNSAFINAGKAGVSFLQTQRNVVFENSESSINEQGISFDETRANNIPQVTFNRVFICSDEKTILFRDQILLYFKIPKLKNTRASESCQKLLTVSKGRGIKMTLMNFSGMQPWQRLQVYDSANTLNIIVDKYNRDLTTLVDKELFIPRDIIVVKWTGDVNSELLIQVKEFIIEDGPCTYETGFCGWQTFHNMSINELYVTRTWKIMGSSYYHDREADYSYFSRNGKRLYIGNDRWRISDGRAGLVSPVITKQSQLCSVVFFYRLGRQGSAGLSLYIQTGRYPNIRQALIWSAKNVLLRSWKKVILDLPTSVDEYRLLLEGEYNKTSSYWYKNYVAVDNLELRRCSIKEHRVSNSVFSGNTHQAITYTSVTTGSDVRPRIIVERCKITDNPALPSSAPEKSAISVEIQDNSFTLTNSFIARNSIGAIQVYLGRSDGTMVPKSFIYANTFDSNVNAAVVVEPRKGLKTNYSFVYIMENTFGSNLDYDSTVKLSEMQSEIANNFFYNNSGLHCIRYDFSSPWPKEQKCELNTFFLNKGLGQNYGVTVLSNGPMQYHRNNFKNPSNLYEFSSTKQPVYDVIAGVKNWWGVGTEPAVGLRIYEKEDDYQLASVEYTPFLKLPPKNILSLGCPADWLNEGSTCYTFRLGSTTFKEAQEYCQYYGGRVTSTDMPGDMEFINLAMQAKRPDGKPLVPMWVTSTENMREEDENEQPKQHCTVMTQYRLKKVVPCNSLYPFVCTRIAVIRCPNGCFHNGDCVGTTCFCHRGWTGPDCSQFHCKDVHNCSGNGQCVGPNVCRCTPGFLGRGCTYSYCTKFRRCSTCAQDSACGWCDSLQQCMPGRSSGPYTEKCPDWFYYTCYTIGSVNHCSNQIQRVDCKNRQCNVTQVTTTSESCQKCTDLEKCYNHVEEGKCRAWNDTQCPCGLVKVDYTDPNRIKNTLLRSNVKVVNPNTTTIYSCSVMIPGRDSNISVFVAPRSLGIKAGDVLSSPQAGGLMHKVNTTTDTGPYTIVLGNPAQIEDVIQYADFSERVSPVPLTDKSTVDEEPDEDELSGLIDGSIKLNETNLHVLPSNTSVFKCVGHIYKIGDELVSTQFLVLEKEQSINVGPGDVIVSEQSHGFIEEVTRVNRTSNIIFLETELERCTENSTWTHRFNSGSPSDNDVVCTGGDNSNGLIITEPGQQNQVSVNDSIIGRSSGAFIAKVVESHASGDFVLIEVLYVHAVINGTAVTAARLDELEKEHRQHKRAIDNETIRFRESFQREYKVSHLGKGYITVQQTYKLYTDFIVSMGVFTDRDQNGDFTITDVLFGAEMTGEAIYNVGVQIGIEDSNVFFDPHPFKVVRPVQLADFCISITGVCIPSALFFEANVDVVVNATGKVHVPMGFTSSAQLRLGGFCRRRGGCRKINPHFRVNRNLNNGNPTAEGEYAAEVSVFVPKVTLRVPSVPRYLRRLVNISNSLWKKFFKNFLNYSSGNSSSTGDFSIIRLSLEAPFRLETAIKPCNAGCIKTSSRQPNEFSIGFGSSEVVGCLTIGFGDKNFGLAALRKKLYSGGWEKSFCFSCGNNKDNCGCPTTPPPATTKSTTTEEITAVTGTTRSTTPYTGSTTPYTGSTTQYTGSTTSYTGSNTPYTGSTTPCTGTTSSPTTPAPSTPLPCKCGDGKNGFVGPNGNCNCPPCPEHPPCGKHPNCVVGRKGPGFSQPDVQPCSSDCSGNGAAVALPDCGSHCVCSVRWTGTCCETRTPWRNWGDPHLETLDGIEFDYYGIGEFWGCKSIFNDFGIQFRYFAYQRASLTGGVAIKAGRSVLTIMTVNTSDKQEFPRLRIDGILVNITAHIGKKMKLDNGTVVMDIQKTFSSTVDESGIVLISLQYESGLTVTADVRHSQVMSRHYMNVVFTPTVAFKGHTKGLCGVMDNDPSNDLRGSDGEQYNDPIQFAESWRITAAHNNSGLKASWSWNSSNFHSNDVMDWSYTDPNFVPLYSLDGIDDAIVAKANEVCSSLGLSKTMLQSCVYDVAVTNDTSLTTQETLQQGCPDQCSGKGRCVNSTCQCMIGWSGDSCQLGDCSNCSTVHGKCVKGFCECDDGWEGVTCEQQATCNNVNNCTGPKSGICRRTDECRCHDGYIGDDCSIIPTCANVSDCSGRGICVDYDVCKCKKEWTGKDCTKYSCGSLDCCSGHGKCVALYKCDCDPGWTGVSCAVPDCAGANQCSGKGECVSSDTCRCYPGFHGVNCSDIANCAYLGNCSGHGVCLQKDPGGNLACRCYAGYSSPNCSIASCLSVNNCSSHGLCIEANLCKCDVGYTGADCANASCEGVNYCSGHGVCTGYETCACDYLWHGPACSEANCPSLDDCSSKGACILPNVCECYPGYDGAACNTTAKPNIHTPVFAASMYNVSVSENVPIGTKILRVQASDADSGRNAQIFFSLDDDSNAGPMFTINSISGEIFTSSTFDYESSAPHYYKLATVASDNGLPCKSSLALVLITIVDENDNCPVFNSLQTKSFSISRFTNPGTLLTVVSAVDKDSGLKGEVRYRFSSTSEQNGAFAVNEENGTVFVAKRLKQKKYRLLVVAHDLGVPSCSRQTELTVNVFDESPITTEEPSGKLSTAATTEGAMNSTKTKKITEIPITQPNVSWYKNPAIIIGLSFGGSATFVLILLAIVVVVSRKCKHRVKPAPDYPAIWVNRLGAMAGRDNSGQSTINGDIAEDLEMENVVEVLDRVKGTEQYEMKTIPRVDL